jgi:hypothetical protein
MSIPNRREPFIVIQPDGKIEYITPPDPITPIEAQECANCYYARPENLLRAYPYATPENYVWCHYHAPQQGEEGARNAATPVRRDAWCGQWKLHPSFAELLSDVKEANG